VNSVFVLPGSRDYESLRRPAIGRFQDVRPRAVARCATPADVAEAISYARARGLAMAVRSGGHCFAGRSSTDGVVIDVTPMGGVTLTGSATVTVGAGTRLGDLYDALTVHGVTIPAGCGPTVGIAGLTLGGGLGILGRRYGLTCDALRAARVVLADGRVVECDEQRDADLFWALRGGGNGGGDGTSTLGVVTSLTFETVPAPEATGFHLTWPAGNAGAVIDAVIQAWQAWAPDAPDELAASLVISTAADSARPPVISVFGAWVSGGPQGTEAGCRSLLDELATRVGTVPASAEYRYGSFRATKRYLTEVDVHGTGEPEPPATEVHSYSKSEFFDRQLSPDTVAALVEHLIADRRSGEVRELDFTPWGGAYNRVARDATAFPHRGERFLLKQSAVVPRANPGDLARRWLDRSWELTHPYGTGGVYPNFPDPDLADPAGAYYGANRARLDKVKAAYDPENVF
jgi:FAD/FMN-containing dehydrogenase